MAGDKKGKRKPRGERFPAKRRARQGKRAVWSLLVLLAFGLLLYTAFDLYRSFSTTGAHAVTDGKRVVIDVLTGKIAIAPPPAPPETVKSKMGNDTGAEGETESTGNEHGTELSGKAQHDVKAPQAGRADDMVIPPKLFSGKIGVLVTGLGMNRESTEAAIGLPKEVTLSFSPYTVDMATLAGEASKKGHALFLDLPTETNDYPYTDPGPYALLSSATAEQNMFRLQKLLNMINNLQGVYLNPNDTLSDDETAMVPVLDRLAQQKKALVFTSDAKSQYAADQAHALGIAYLNQYLPLDNVASGEAIASQMHHVYEHIKADKGNLLIVLKPYPASFTQLRHFIKDYTDAGYRLAPAGELLVK